MTDEKKERIKQLRQRLANLSDTERQALANQGIVATVEGRPLSLHNTMLVYLQSNGNTPSIVGGYKQWQRAGKQVQKGEHGYLIWFPVGQKDEESGDVVAAENFYTATVFDISQVN